MGGLLTSRGRIHVHREEETSNTRQRSRNNPYAYPPADEGSYFSSHYHLGHRKFESGEPELFLFGELNDINFLNTKPVSFPYKQPGRHQPIRCLQSYINVHRDSVKLKKTEASSDVYTLEFLFDSDVNCCFTIYTKVPDTVELEALRNGSYSGEGVSVSRSFHYSAGSGQEFKEEGFTIRPTDFEDEMTYDPENEHTSFPVIILMETDTPQAPENQQQAHVSICNIDRPNGNGYNVKTFKQKLIVEGIEYLLQEIYGLENKAPDEEPERRRDGDDSDSDDDDNDDIEELGAECVICITDVRDTLLLPCRHLCLCAGCAANLRYQSSNCPVCRAPFRALLQIQALQPLDPNELIDDDEMTGNPKYSTPGFQCVPLLQALNGYRLEREETGPEAEAEDQPPEEGEIEQGVDATEEGEPSSPQTTEFCVVVPIEDSGEHTSSSIAPAKPPVRTDMTKKNQQEKNCVVVDETSIPLPGTPTNDFDDEERSGSVSHTSIKSRETVGQLALNMDVERSQEHVIPDSPRSSESFSSRGSTKSTDVLLPTEK